MLSHIPRSNVARLALAFALLSSAATYSLLKHQQHRRMAAYSSSPFLAYAAGGQNFICHRNNCVAKIDWSCSKYGNLCSSVENHGTPCPPGEV